MKDNKELIDLIRDGLKNAGELPYKEGAWEAYKAKHEPTPKVHRLIPLWVAAAVAAVAGFIFLFNNEDRSIDPVKVAEVEQATKNVTGKTGNESDAAAKLETDRLASADIQQKENNDISTPLFYDRSPQTKQRMHMVIPDKMDVQSFSWTPSENVPTLDRELKAAGLMVLENGDDPTAALDWDDELIAGQQIDPNFAYQNETARNLSPKKIRLTDRFELGAFVSPSTTDRSFDLGGGLVFAYRLNDKIAIRTGASFNQYEVGMLGSQVKEVREEKMTQSAPVVNNDKLISKETTAFRNNNLFIPNLNAVTGKVQTLDIPLEVKYNLTNQFYATGGVSYAAVLSQERFDHYEESVGIPTYSSASDSEKPVKNTVSTVSTTVKSDDDNINTNGFGGFVNFSVGRRVNVGKTMKVSVEPFVKLPVGQFRRADMDYTNGGIRIITSF